MAEKAIFFYDQMLESKSTTVRLYQNDDEGDEIIRGFYRDDFHVGLMNQWATGGSSIVKMLVDGAANMINSRAGKEVTNFVQKGLQSAISAGNGDVGIAGFNVNKASEMIDSMQKYQHSSFFTADDFYKTFKGSTVTFPTNIQVTLISDEYLGISDNGNPLLQEKDIFYKLKKLLDVSLGEYETDPVLGFVGIQNAPNGFRTGGFDLTQDLLEGSLMVKYGDPEKGGFTVRNMLISNVHFTFSKTKVIVGNKTDDEGNSGAPIYRPLYVDLQIMLEPGKKFTKDDLVRTIGGDLEAMANYEQRQELMELEKLEKELADKEQEEKDRLSKLENTPISTPLEVQEKTSLTLINTAVGQMTTGDTINGPIYELDENKVLTVKGTFANVDEEYAFQAEMTEKMKTITNGFDEDDYGIPAVNRVKYETKLI